MSPEALFARARTLESESAAEAEALYQDLLRQVPDYPNAAFRLAMLLHQRGLLAEAESAYRLELSARPAFWSCRANLAQLLKERHLFSEALTECLQALNDCPEPLWQIDLLMLAARLLRDTNQPESALSQLEQAEQLQNSLPSAPNPQLQRELARTCRLLGRSQAARWHYQRALSQGAGPLLVIEAAEYLLSLQRFHEGIALLEDLLAAHELPQWRSTLLAQIANAWQELNDPRRAREAYDRAIRETPAEADGLQLARSLVLPVVYPDSAALTHWRQQLQTGLETLVQAPLAISNPLDLGALPFYLAYQGCDDRPIMELQAEIYRKLRSTQLSSERPSKRVAQQGKLRIGCVSHFFYSHSVMHCFLDLLLELGQAPFELHCFAASPLIEDAVTRELRGVAASWTRLQGPLEQQAEQIWASGLDLLLYTDMGLDPHTYLLAQHALAPRQVLLPGHPVTSGLKGFDAFVSDRLSEPEQASEHYTEPLLLLDQLATIYRRPVLRSKRRSRASLGLPTTERLYLCPGQAFKFHPDMDTVLRGILQADPGGRLLLLDLTSNGLIQAVLARLGPQLNPQELARVTVLPRFAPDDFLQLLSQVDVMLETFPFGSVNTLMAAFAVGTPVVTLPGEFMRGRLCLGLYRQMDIPGPVVITPEAYIETAVKLARDTRQRQQLSQQILERSDRIFMNRAVGVAFRQHLSELCC